jgi:hypothetical protein
MDDLIEVPRLLGKSTVRFYRDGSYGIPRRDAEAEKWLDEHCLRRPNELRWLPKIPNSISVESLRGIFQGLPCYIIGKGPSLDDLTPLDFGDIYAPIIAINEAVMIINGLGLPNPVFLIQGDTGLTIDPGPAALLLGLYIKHLYPNHPERYVFRSEMFGFGVSARLSVEMAIHIAALMGCTEGIMYAFDAATTEDCSYAESIGHTPEQKGRDEKYPGYRFLGHRRYMEKEAKKAGLPIKIVAPTLSQEDPDEASPDNMQP